MDTERRHRSSPRVTVQAVDWLDEFDAESAIAAESPGLGRSDRSHDSMLLFASESGEVQPLPSRQTDRRAAPPQPQASPTAFDVVEAGIAPSPATDTPRGTPRVTGIAIVAVLCSTALLASADRLSRPARAVGPAAPAPLSPLSAHQASGGAALALSPPPAVAAPTVGVHNVPDVYEIPTTPETATVVVPDAVVVPDPGADIEAVRRALRDLTARNPAFEHCDVRFTSAGRAIALCKGTGGDRSEWTIDLSRSTEAPPPSVPMPGG